MDVMSDHQHTLQIGSPPPLIEGKVESLDAATYLGSVADPGNINSSLMQLMETSSEYPSGTVYLSPSLYTGATVPSSTYYDTSGSFPSLTNISGTNNPQLISYGGSTFLIQPGPEGSSSPLITAVSRPSAPAAQGSHDSISNAASAAAAAAAAAAMAASCNSSGAVVNNSCSPLTHLTAAGNAVGSINGLGGNGVIGAAGGLPALASSLAPTLNSNNVISVSAGGNIVTNNGLVANSPGMVANTNHSLVGNTANNSLMGNSLLTTIGNMTGLNAAAAASLVAAGGDISALVAAGGAGAANGIGVGAPVGDAEAGGADASAPTTDPGAGGGGSLVGLAGGHTLSYATRVSPVTIQWLINNYETAEGVSLPRSTLYNHYLKHCNETKQDPVNAASFGKLIRSVFLGLRTRRIGTRGNSKYHYYGIRVKPTSPLNSMDNNSSFRVNSITKKKLPTAVSNNNNNNNNSIVNNNQAATNVGSKPNLQQVQQENGVGANHLSLGQYLGSSDPLSLPELNLTKEDNLPANINITTIADFTERYKTHLSELQHAVITCDFSSVETIWADFWRLTDLKYHNLEDSSGQIAKVVLLQLMSIPKVGAFVRESDYKFYQSLVKILIPNVLRPIPPALTQAIRNFAKSLEPWLAAAMTDWPQEIRNLKLSSVRTFAQTLKRYTSLNHLAQAARAVLQNSQQVTQMLSDLNRVDFKNVQEQASWVCGCDLDMVSTIEKDFKETLMQETSLESWSIWLEKLVDKILAPYQGTKNYVQVARKFLLRWSFYSSMIIRDLTLRSATSFGSFHLIRLLYDEFMFYIVEHRVAKELDLLPMAVMCSNDMGLPSHSSLIHPKDFGAEAAAQSSNRTEPDSASPRSSMMDAPSQPPQNPAEAQPKLEASRLTSRTHGLDDDRDGGRGRGLEPCEESESNLPAVLFELNPSSPNGDNVGSQAQQSLTSSIVTLPALSTSSLMGMAKEEAISPVSAMEVEPPSASACLAPPDSLPVGPNASDILTPPPSSADATSCLSSSSSDLPALVPSVQPSPLVLVDTRPKMMEANSDDVASLGLSNGDPEEDNGLLAARGPQPNESLASMKDLMLESPEHAVRDDVEADLDGGKLKRVKIE